MFDTQIIIPFVVSSCHFHVNDMRLPYNYKTHYYFLDSKPKRGNDTQGSNGATLIIP